LLNHTNDIINVSDFTQEKIDYLSMDKENFSKSQTEEFWNIIQEMMALSISHNICYDFKNIQFPDMEDKLIDCIDENGIATKNIYFWHKGQKVGFFLRGEDKLDYINEVRFSYTTFKNADFENVIFEVEVDFSYSNIQTANFDNTYFDKVYYSDSFIKNISLANMKADTLIFTSANIDNIKLSSSNITNIFLNSGKFKNIEFYNTTIDDKIDASSLVVAEKLQIQNSQMQNGTFMRSDLCEVNLTNSTIKKSNFSSCVIGKLTIDI